MSIETQERHGCGGGLPQAWHKKGTIKTMSVSKYKITSPHYMYIKDTVNRVSLLPLAFADQNP